MAAQIYQKGTVLGLRPGDIVDGRFQIGALVGYGGQGVVLRVKHLEWGQELALKLPLPEVVQHPVHRERYLKEAESWIRLGVHPNIVRCWFVHKVSGLPGLFLDFIEGGSLEERMKAGQFKGEPWSEILTTLCQICEGLAHSHSMGLVHRDIKPENILLRKDGTLSLTDFGLVKTFVDMEEEQSGEQLPTDSSVTGTGQFVGSPRYGAPEQWNKALRIGPATDVYALGVLFFELMCGRRPFDAPGENPDPLTLIHRHLGAPPPDPRSFRPDIPPEMAELCLHCLSKNSEYRPPSATALLEILSGLLRTVCNETYQPPTPVPDGDRPDLLNNAAVSLHSLGKYDECRELLQRGLLLQAGHPQCLYNLVQMERREARITGGESIRRLRRGAAVYELALLCLEEGLGKQSRALLDAIPERDKNGLHYRIEGDSLMYAQNYTEAAAAYEKARKLMPFDVPTRKRLELSLKATNHDEGVIYFPSSSQVGQLQEPRFRFTLSPNGERLIAVDENQVLTLSFDGSGGSSRHPRNAQIGLPERLQIGDRVMSVQYAHHFERWRLVDMAVFSQGEGRILCATDDGEQAFVYKEGELLLLGPSPQTITFPQNMPPNSSTRASFTPDNKGVCLLTSTGRIAQVDGNYHARVLDWPPPLPRFQKISHFKMGSGTLLYTATSTGHANAIDFSARKMRFSLKLPFTPESLVLDRSEELAILSSSTQFGILDTQGKVKLRGPGPFATDGSRRYGLRWCDGYLMLYQLSPLRRLRTFTDKIEQPVSLSISRNGRRAVSVSASGEHKVWELDEDHRVYERNLLLTPGASYHQLVESYNSFLQLMTQAQRLHQKSEAFLAYTSIRNARHQLGYDQQNTALELQWSLADELQRKGMEAIWERLHETSVLATSLSTDGNKLLVLSKRTWAIRDFRTATGAILTSGQLSQKAVYGELLEYQGSLKLVLLYANGALEFRSPDTGEVLLTTQTAVGELRVCRDAGSHLILYGSDGLAYALNKSDWSLTPPFRLADKGVASAFELGGDELLVPEAQGSYLVKLSTQGKDLKPLLQLAGELPATSFACITPEPKLTILGFRDGTMHIGESKSRRVLFSHQEKTAVTAASISALNAVAAIGTLDGHLTILDLKNGKISESFVAHNEPISKVTVCPRGRYVQTLSKKGQFRFWELSWSLSEEKGANTIPWLPTGALGKLGRIFRFGG